MALQSAHALPAVPQVVSDEVWQLLPTQHPVQVVAHPLHAPPMQVSGEGQSLHMPELPQAFAVVPGWHACVVGSQHPDLHEVASHSHLPRLQTSPGPHAAPSPQLCPASAPDSLLASGPDPGGQPPSPQTN
jgi:hypothetical protein